MKIHKGVYEREIFGGRIFIYGFTLCTGRVWMKMTSKNKQVTCKICKVKLKKENKHSY